MHTTTHTTTQTATPTSGQATATPDPTGAPEGYGVVQRKTIYLDDLDGFGMLYHANYATLLDHAILDFWHASGWRIDPGRSVQVIRALSITYNAPVLGTGEVDVHLWVEQAGRSSVTYAFEVLSADHRTVHAAGQRVLVNLDPQTLEPAPLSDEMWDIAAPLLKPGVTRPTPA